MVYKRFEFGYLFRTNQENAVNGTRPQSYPSRGMETRKSNKTILWRDCLTESPSQYNVTDLGYIIDWSGNQDGSNRNAEEWEKGLSAGLWWSSSGFPQTQWWKVGAALVGEVKLTKPVIKGNVTACVPSPYVFLIGNITVVTNGCLFNVTCKLCNLTNCVTVVPQGTAVMLLKQPSFVMLPVNVSGPWYDDKGLQVIEEIKHALSREKRMIGLIIAGVLALISLIATVATAAVALSLTVQNAHYVNELSRNITSALGTQENIDKKLEQKNGCLICYGTILGK